MCRNSRSITFILLTNSNKENKNKMIIISWKDSIEYELDYCINKYVDVMVKTYRDMITQAVVSIGRDKIWILRPMKLNFNAFNFLKKKQIAWLPTHTHKVYILSLNFSLRFLFIFFKNKIDLANTLNPKYLNLAIN